MTAGITTAIVLGVASLSPHDVWQQPILRLVDTALGTAVGLGTAWIALRLTAAGAGEDNRRRTRRPALRPLPHRRRAGRERAGRREWTESIDLIDYECIKAFIRD